MTIQVESVSAIKKRLTVVIDAETVGAEYEKVFKLVRKEARVRGFRPGKAPVGMIKQQYGEYIEDEIKRNLVGEALGEAIDTEDIKVAAQPELEKADLNEDGTLTIIAVVETMPEVELGEYSGLEITREEVKILDAAVDTRIEGLRRQHATVSEVADRDVCETGDFVRIDFIGRRDGVAFDGGSHEGYMLELGSQSFIPGFEEGVVGMKVGETKKLNVPFPDGDTRQDLAGQEVEFEVTVQAINKRNLPELDDEFAKDTQLADTIEGVRQKITDDIREAEEARTKRAAKRELIDKLVELHAVEVPQGMIDRQLEYMLRSHKIELAMAGVPIKDDPATDEALKERLAPDAKKEVQSFFIFRAIAEAESLEVGEDDIEARLQEIAKRQEREVAEVSAQYQKDNMLESLKEELLDEKVVDFLLERAKITWDDPLAPAAEQGSEPAVDADDVDDADDAEKTEG